MSRVLNLLLTHTAPAEVEESVRIWEAIAPRDQLFVAYGGSPANYASLNHPHRAFIADERLRTRNHQHERQSLGGVFSATAAWLRDQDFSHIFLVEYDYLPLIPQLHTRLLEQLAVERADVLGHGVIRVDGSNWPPFLNHIVDPRFGDLWDNLSVRRETGVVLNIFGTGSFWTREAFEAVAANSEPFPIYLEIFLPTMAHHLGYRVRTYGGPQDQFFLRNVDRLDQIHAARAAGSWTIHPVKSAALRRNFLSSLTGSRDGRGTTREKLDLAEPPTQISQS